MVHIILSALAPIVFVTFLGWLAGRLGLMKHEDRGVLGLFVVRFALPLAPFLSATKATVDQLTDVAYFVSLAVGMVGIYVAVFLVARLAFKQDLTAAALRALTCSFPNMAYCGPPVLLAAIGQEALLAVLVGNLISSFVLVPATIVLAHLGEEPPAGEEKQHFLPLLGSSLLGAVRQPLVWLPLAGIVLALSGIGLPVLLEASVHQIGQAAGGVALFMLGLMLYGQPVRVDRTVLTNVALKNFVQPAIVFVCAALLGMSGAGPADRPAVCPAVRHRERCLGPPLPELGAGNFDDGRREHTHGGRLDQPRRRLRSPPLDRPREGTRTMRGTHGRELRRPPTGNDLRATRSESHLAGGEGVAVGRLCDARNGTAARTSR